MNSGREIKLLRKEKAEREMQEEGRNSSPNKSVQEEEKAERDSSSAMQEAKRDKRRRNPGTGTGKMHVERESTGIFKCSHRGERHSGNHGERREFTVKHKWGEK